MMRDRFGRVLLAAPTLFGTGCLLPYAYPKVSYIPAVSREDFPADARAFRVDVTARHADAGENGEHTIGPITPLPGGSVPPQARASLDHGIAVWGPLSYTAGEAHTTRVRLYRPGYRTVEITSWALRNDVKWEKAADWSAQEQAVDDLLRCPSVLGKHTKPAAVPEAASGETLLFAAAEYERVSGLARESEAARLREKARTLREAAGR